MSDMTVSKAQALLDGAKKAIRPIRIEGGVAYVTLTKGHTAIIDAEDVPLVAAWNWCAVVGTWTVYAARTVYMGAGASQATVYLHRALLGADKSDVVDHKDSDGLNNRRSNIRLTTTAMNNRNVRQQKKRSSIFKGVSWHSKTNKWLARIRVDGRRVHLGVFADEARAAEAYMAASEQYHREFGRTS